MVVDRSHIRLYRTDELTQPGVGNLRPALLAGLVGVAAQVALTAPFMSRYGWDRDELYFLSAAHHPALGYVDFPPLTKRKAEVACGTCASAWKISTAASKPPEVQKAGREYVLLLL